MAPPVGVLLLRVEVGENEDPLLYCYPSSPIFLKRAASLKGLFLALGALTRTLSAAEIRVASLSSRDASGQSLNAGNCDQITNQSTKAAYMHLEPLVLVFLLPGQLVDAVALTFAESMKSSLLFSIGSTAGWFARNGSQLSLRADVEPRLTELFQGWFRELPDTLRSFNTQQLLGSLPDAVPFFQASSEVHAKLAEFVNLAETSGGTPEERCLRRGTWLDYREACLIHRGLVVYSDTSKENAANMWNLCNREGLICRGKWQGQHILLQDVYIQTGWTGAQLRGERQNSRNTPEVGPCERRALVVVGLGPTLLCLLLEPETKDLGADQLAESPELDAAISQMLALSQAGTLEQLDAALGVSGNDSGGAEINVDEPSTGLSERLSYNRRTGFVTNRGVEGGRHASEFQSSASTLRERLLLTQVPDHRHNPIEKLFLPHDGPQQTAELSVRLETASVAATTKKSKRRDEEKRDATWITGRFDRCGQELYLCRSGRTLQPAVEELFLP